MSSCDWGFTFEAMKTYHDIWKNDAAGTENAYSRHVQRGTRWGYQP